MVKILGLKTKLKTFAEAIKEALTIHIDWSQSLDGYGNEKMRLDDFGVLSSLPRCAASAAPQDVTDVVGV